MASTLIAEGSTSAWARKSKMLRNLVSRRGRDQDLRALALAGDAVRRVSWRQHQASDRQVFERHRDEIFDLKGDDLGELGRILEGKRQGSDEQVLTRNRGYQPVCGIESVPPEESTQRLHPSSRFKIFGTGKRQRMLEIIDRFVPAQPAAETHGLQSRLSDVQPDTFVHNSHESTLDACF